MYCSLSAQLIVWHSVNGEYSDIPMMAGEKKNKGANFEKDNTSEK